MTGNITVQYKGAQFRLRRMDKNNFYWTASGKGQACGGMEAGRKYLGNPEAIATESARIVRCFSCNLSPSDWSEADNRELTRRVITEFSRLFVGEPQPDLFGEAKA